MVGSTEVDHSETPDEIEHTHNLLRIHRHSIRRLETQIAQHGGEMVAPLHLLTHRDDINAEIERLEEQLNKLQTSIAISPGKAMPLDPLTVPIHGSSTQKLRREHQEDDESVIGSLERAEKIYREAGDATSLLVIQKDLVGLLVKQGDSYYIAGNPNLALGKYLYARDQISSLEDKAQEVQILGKLARLYEEQDITEKALSCRLDQIDCLVKLGSTREVHSGIKRVRNLCRQLENMQATQYWIEIAYRLVVNFFTGEEDLAGLAVLKDSVDEFKLDKLKHNIDIAVASIQAKIRRRQIEPNMPEWVMKLIEGTRK
jgi:tetratricopeptide (TPR) repeat protein